MMKKTQNRILLTLGVLMILLTAPVLTAGAQVQEVSGDILSFSAPRGWYTYSSIAEMPNMFEESFDPDSGMFAMAATQLTEAEMDNDSSLPGGFIMVFGIPFPAEQKSMMPPNWQEMMIQQYAGPGAAPQGGRIKMAGMEDFAYLMIESDGEDYSFVPQGSAMGMAVGFFNNMMVYVITYNHDKPRENEAFLKTVTTSLKAK